LEYDGGRFEGLLFGLVEAEFDDGFDSAATMHGVLRATSWSPYWPVMRVETMRTQEGEGAGAGGSDVAAADDGDACSVCGHRESLLHEFPKWNWGRLFF
jgi:hypothetical protein